MGRENCSHRIDEMNLGSFYSLTSINLRFGGKRNMRRASLVGLLIMLIFVIPVPSITTPAGTNYSESKTIQGTDSWSVADTTFTTGTGMPLSYSMIGTATNTYDGSMIIDSTSPSTTTVSLDDGWTGSGLETTVDTMVITDSDQLLNGDMNSYHTEKFLGTSFNSEDVLIPDNWALTKTDNSGTGHPHHGVFEFNSFSSSGYESTQGFRFDANWGASTSLSSTDSIYIGQMISAPYRELVSAEVQFYYRVDSVSDLNDQVYLVLRFGNYEYELHAFASGSTTDTWLSATVPIPISTIDAISLPDSILLEIGLATDLSGSQASARDAYVYVDSISVDLDVRPFPEQVGLTVNGTDVVGSEMYSISPFLPDGENRDGYDPDGSGFDLDGYNNDAVLSVGTWGTSWSDTSPYQIGLQFPLNIPSGAAITQAYIEVESAGVGTMSDMRLYLASRDSSLNDISAFTNGGAQLEDRLTFIDTSVDWSPSAWSYGERYYSPDFSALLQKGINENGWNAGDHVAIMLDFMYASSYQSYNDIKGSYGSFFDAHELARIYVEYIIPNAEDTVANLAYKKDITINSARVAATLTDFPVLVDIYDSDLKTDAQKDGDDIAFVQNGVQLAHEIEYYDHYYNSTHAHLIAWVNVPTLSGSSDTIIEMHYGDSEVGNLQNAAGVWNTGYESVWHMNNNLTAGQLIDSTENNYDGVSFDMAARNVTDGQIDGAYEFAGSSERAIVGQMDTDSWGAITLESWFYLDTDGDYRIISKEVGTGGGPHIFMIGVDNTQTLKVRIYTDGGNTDWNSPDDAISLSTWHHLVVTFDQSLSSNEVRVYLDGSYYYGEGNSGSTFDDSNTEVTIGDNSEGTRSFDGIIDEVRISNTARSSNWILTQFRNQDSPNSFLSVGSEQTNKDSYGSTETASLEFATSSTDPVSLETTASLTISGSGQSLDENMNTGTTFVVDNGTEYVNWTANVLISPPPNAASMNAYIDYPQTEWKPTSVTNPVGQSKTYGTDWTYTGGKLTIFADAVDIWGVWVIEFESMNYILDAKIGHQSQTLGNTDIFDINDVFEMQATTPWITDSRVGLVLTDPTGSQWHTDYATTTGTPTHQIPSFQYRKSITVSSSEVDADLTNYPMLVDILDSDLYDTSKVQSDGDDIVFVSANGDILPHEIEFWNQDVGGSQAQLVAWVKTNLSSTSDTTIYMYYGNPFVGPQEQPDDVWTEGHAAVWHLGENTIDEETTAIHYDSTTGGYDGNQIGNVRADGISGYSQSFATDDWIEINDTENLDPSDDVTISGWFYLSSSFSSTSPTTQVIMEKYISNDDDMLIALVGTDYGNSVPDGSLVFKVENSDGGYMYKYSQRTAWSPGWYHFACILDSDNPVNNKIFVNGADNTNAGYLGSSSYNSLSFSGHWGIGGRYSDTQIPGGEGFFNGRIDQVEVSNGIRSDAWIAAQYSNLYTSSTFRTIGSEQSRTSPDLTLTKTIDSTAPAGVWTASVYYNDTGVSVTNATGLIEREFIVQHDTTLTIVDPYDAVSDRTSLRLAGDLLEVELNLTDDITSGSVTGATVTMNWTQSSSPIEITLDDYGDGSYGVVLNTSDLGTAQRWRINIASYHPYYNNATEYFDLDLYHETKLTYLNVTSTPIGFDSTATLVYWDVYDDAPITGATIAFENGTTITTDAEGNGYYNISLDLNYLGLGNHWFVFDASKSDSFMADADTNVTFTVRKHYTSVSVQGDFVTPFGFNTNVTVVLIDMDTGTSLSTSDVASLSFNSVSYSAQIINLPGSFDQTLTTNTWGLGDETVTLSVSLVDSIYFTPDDYAFTVTIRKHYTTVSVVGDFLSPYGFNTSVTIILTDSDTGTAVASTNVNSFTFTPAANDPESESNPSDYIYEMDTDGWVVGIDTVTLTVDMTGSDYFDPNSFDFDIEIRKHYTSVTISGDLSTPWGQNTTLTISLIDTDLGTSVTVGNVASFTFDSAIPSSEGESNPSDYIYELDTDGWSVGIETVTLTVDMTGSDYFDPDSYNFDIQIRNHYTAVTVKGNMTTPAGMDTDLIVEVVDLDTGTVVSVLDVNSFSMSWTGDSQNFDGTSYSVTLLTNTWALGTETVTITVDMTGSDYFDPDTYDFDITIRKHFTSVSVSGDYITPYGETTDVTIIIYDSDTGTQLAAGAASWFNFTWTGGFYEQNPASSLTDTLPTDSWSVSTVTVTLEVSMSGSNYMDPDFFSFDVTIRKHYTSVTVTGDLTSPYGNTTDLTVKITDLDTGTLVTYNNVDWLNFTWATSFHEITTVSTFDITIATDSWVVGATSVTLSVSMGSSDYFNPTDYTFDITIHSIETDLSNEFNDMIFPNGDDFNIILRLNITEQGQYYGNPLTGLTATNFTVKNSTGSYVFTLEHLNDGRYNLTIAGGYFPEGQYTIYVAFVSTDSRYRSSSITIVFEYRPARSELSSGDRTVTTPYQTDYTVTLTFTDIDRDEGILDATITAEGVEIYGQQNLGNGLYRITVNITSLSKGTHYYNLTADADGYENQTLSFTVVIRIAYTYAIPSTGALDIPVGNSPVFYVEYWDIDRDMAITGATVDHNWTETISVTMVGEEYKITFTTSDSVDLGTYLVMFNFSKGENYQFGLFNLTVVVRTHNTDFRLVSAVEPTAYNGEIEISVFYGDLDTAGAGIVSNLISYEVWNASMQVSATMVNDTTLGAGYYLITISASQFNGLGIQDFTVYFNWTGSVYKFQNKTVGASANIVGEDSRYTLILSSEPTPYLTNMSYTFFYSRSNGDGIINDTGDVHINVVFTGESVDLSKVDIWEVDQTNSPGNYSVRFNTSIFSHTGLIYMRVYINWSYGVAPFYTNRTDTISVRVLARDTLVSLVPASATPYSEIASFTFNYEDALIDESIENSTSLNISLSLSEYTLSYELTTRTFTVEFNTTQFGGLGQQSFTLDIVWYGSPFYQNKTGRTVFVTVTTRDTVLDYQSPAPTPYMDNVTFTVTWTDVTGSSTSGITGANVTLYYLGAEISSSYYKVTEGTNGEYTIELNTTYFLTPGSYVITANMTSLEIYYDSEDADRSLTITKRVTSLTSDPFDAVPYNSSFTVILYYQDTLTLSDIANNSDVFFTIETAGSWLYTINWIESKGYYELIIETYNQPSLEIGVEYSLQLNMSFSYESPFYNWDDTTITFELRYRESSLERETSPVQTSYLDWIDFIVYYGDADGATGIPGATITVEVGGSPLTLVTEYTYTDDADGYYSISVASDALGGIGSFGIDVWANWSMIAPFHDNASLSLSLTVIRRPTDVTIVSTPSRTSYLENITFVIELTDLGYGTTISSVTKNLLHIYNGVSELASSDFDFTDIGSNQFEISIDSTVITSVLVSNLQLNISIDWPDSPNYYRDDSTLVRVTIIARTTALSIEPPTNTAYGENASLQLGYIDTTTVDTLIENANNLSISTNLTEIPQITYNAGTKLFSISLDTSQFGSIGKFVFHINVTWVGSPYYANRTFQQITVTITLRQSQLDYQAPAPTPYGDNVSFSITYEDIAGSVDIGIDDAEITLYNGTTQIPLNYYQVELQGNGLFNFEFYSGFFETPGYYNINASFVYNGTNYVADASAIRILNVRYRTTLVSSEPVGSIGYGTTMEIILYYQDMLTLDNIGNLTPQTTLTVLNGTDWDFTITWQEVTGTYRLLVETADKVLPVGETQVLYLNMSYQFDSPYYYWDTIYVSFTVRNRVSSLDVQDAPVPAAYLEYAEFTMYYWDVDVTQGIAGATISIETTTTFSEGSDFFVSEGSPGVYNIQLNTTALPSLGVFQVKITAIWNGSAPYHNNASRNVTVSVTQRDAEVEIISPPSQTRFLDNLTFTFTYTDILSSSSISVSSSDVLIYSEGLLLGANEYVITPSGSNFFVSINSTVLGSTLVSNLNLTILIDWNDSTSPYYTDDQTSLRVSTVGRTMSVTFGQIESVPIFDNLTIGFYLEDSAKETPISNAIIYFDCQTVSLLEGVSYVLTEGTGSLEGYYNLTVLTSYLPDVGDYNFDLTIHWNATNQPFYANLSTITLTGSIDLIWTSLQSDLPSPSSVEITDSVNVTVYFRDLDHGQIGINAATIFVSYLDTGLVPSNLAITSLPNGVYNISFSTIDLDSTGSYALNITAQRTYYRTSVVQPSFTVTVIRTILTPLEDTIQLSWTENANITVEYENLLNGNLTAGATLTFEWAGGTGFLTEIGSTGVYSANIDTSLANSGTRVIKVYAQKDKFANAVTTITLIVLTLPSDMIPIIPDVASLNLPRGASVPITVYLNDTFNGVPINDTYVQNIYVSFQGVDYPMTFNTSLGYYTATIPGSATELPITFYSVNILAEFINYNPAPYQFKINLQQSRTELKLSGETTKTINAYYSDLVTFEVNFTATDLGFQITEANGTAVIWDLSEVGIQGNFTHVADGIWQAVFNTTLANYGSWGITILGQPGDPVLSDSITTLTLTIKLIPTQATSSLAPTVVWGWEGNVSFYYEDTWNGGGIPAASAIVSWGPYSGINATDIGNGFYSVFINTTILTPGARYPVSISFTKPNYVVGTSSLNVEVTEVPTELIIDSPVQNRVAEDNPQNLIVPMGDTIEVMILYNDTDTTEGYIGGISGASLLDASVFRGVTFDGGRDFSLIPMEDGWYKLVFDTLDESIYQISNGTPVIEDGYYRYTIVLKLTNYQTSEVTIRFRIIEVPTSVSSEPEETSFSLIHGVSRVVRVQFNDTWHGIGITDASLTISSDTPSVTIVGWIEEGDGWYSIELYAESVGVPSAIQIVLSSPYHTNGTAQFRVSVLMNEFDVLVDNSLRIGFPISLFVILILGMYVKVWSVPKRIRQINGQIKAMEKGKLPKPISEVRERRGVIADLWTDTLKGLELTRSISDIPEHSVPVEVPEMGTLLIQLQLLTHLNQEELDEFKSDISKMRMSEQAAFVKEVIHQEAIRAARREHTTVEDILDKIARKAQEIAPGGTPVTEPEKVIDTVFPITEKTEEIDELTPDETKTPDETPPVVDDSRWDIGSGDKLSDFELDELRKELKRRGVEDHEIDNLIDQAKELPREAIDALLDSIGNGSE
ncbi:MAG: DUF2341 domain-containing protein [Candidatus Lokiarchaeota archaeon]|nr:DUF2341 domain-containing protein [Candidatus Lokiarchaeota archaeon]